MAGFRVPFRRNRKIGILIQVFVLVIGVFWISGCQQYATRDLSVSGAKHYPSRFGGKVKNVIFFIGDGMGLAQIAAARIDTLGAKEYLNLERLPVTGLVNTYSADKLITDSAAAATALSTGYKTDNGMIGELPDGRKLYTILEAARDRGMKIGLVATSTITHATPAGFAAHVKSRSSEDLIAVQLLNNRVNVLFGGGKKFFIPQSKSLSGRKDELNLLEKAKEMGYKFIETKEELKSVKGNYVLGLFENSYLDTSSLEPSLAEMTAKAIELLSDDPDGFFLMVEGSQIDWGGHRNSPIYMIRQLVLFDEAVKAGMDYALKDKKTLVLVTADHETGGLTINGGTLDGKKLELSWSTFNHTGVPVPLFAFGPAALKFTGLQDNTEIPRKIGRLIGLSNFPQNLNPRAE